MGEDSAAAARLLRELREHKGRSLRAAAEDLGVAASHLSRWERGERSPSPELRERAARYYGVDDATISLNMGLVPSDIVRILRENPEVLAELRRRYPAT